MGSSGWGHLATAPNPARRQPSRRRHLTSVENMRMALGRPSWGPDSKEILLFGGLIFGVPYFRNPPYDQLL